MNGPTLFSVLARWATEQPEAAAILAPDQEAISFDDLVRRVEANRGQLERAGVAPGDRVALLSPLGPETAVAALSVACFAVCVPLNPALPAPEVAAALKETRAKALVVPTDQETVAEKVARILEIQTLDLRPEPADESRRGAWHGPDPTDVALIMRTSGSTARAKLVPITHAQIVARADKTRRLFDLRPSDRCLSLMPHYYVHGIHSGLMGPLMAGGSVVNPRSVDEETFFACLRLLKPTWYTAGATHHLNVLTWLEHRKAEHTLRFARSGSAALPVGALEELERRLGIPLIESLSASEAGTITSNPPNWSRKPGTVGTTPDDDIAVVDEQGRVLAPGHVGELLVRGLSVVSGYDGDPERTREKFRDGWFHTGDLAELDADGYLRLRGRLDDVINRGGEKISPQEVDAALLAHPAVERALTFAVPHPTLHSDVAAAVVPRAGMTVTQRELQRHLSEHLSPSKIPHRILLTEKLPTAESGKPQRRGAASYFGLTKASAPEPRRLLERALDRARRWVRRGPDSMLPLERSLMESWQRALGRNNLSVDDDFFLCGGDSLSAIRMIAMVEKDLRLTIPMQYLMEERSIRRLAQRLRHEPPGTPDVVGIRTTGSRRPIFAVCGRGGYVLRIVLVGRALGEDQPFYGLQPPGMNWESVGLTTVPQFAAHYIERIKTIQPNGPYRLIGTSFGGLVVYEMALQLQSAGDEVEFLGLVDTYPAKCLLDAQTDSDDARPSLEQGGKSSEIQAASSRVKRTHFLARKAYVLDRQFRGELIYFSCDKWTKKKRADRRHLWAHFATSVRVVPVPGKHGCFHLEPQFSVLSQRLREILDALSSTESAS